MNEPTPWTPPELTPSSAPKFATDEQISAVVAVYAREMYERGHLSDPAPAEVISHLERAARIQDVWRGAFAHVLDEPAAVTSGEPIDFGAMLSSLGLSRMQAAPSESMPVGTTVLPPGALQELLDAARAVLEGYEAPGRRAPVETVAKQRNYGK
jgi:hypothetical protein